MLSKYFTHSVIEGAFHCVLICSIIFFLVGDNNNRVSLDYVKGPQVLASFIQKYIRMITISRPTDQQTNRPWLV